MKRESAEELRARLLADEQVHSLIAMRAYEIFELRGGTPGREAEDWLQAEAEILQFVIEEELRRSEAHFSVDESALVERPTPAFSFPNGATEKGLEIYVSVETEAASSAQPATLAASAGSGSKKDPTPTRTSSPEASKKGDSPPKKAAARLKPPKVSAKKTSGKVKAPKKAGKTKQPKQRSADAEKGK